MTLLMVNCSGELMAALMVNVGIEWNQLFMHNTEGVNSVSTALS